jgi:hypothetical protein
MATLVTKNSSTASAVPLAADLVQGELAVNVTDKRLFTQNAADQVVEVGTNPSILTLPNGTANGVAYLNSSKVLTSGSAFTFDGATLTASNSASTAGVFKATSSAAQVANLQAQNDAGTAINLGVFGSTAGTFGTLGAGTPFLSTAAATLVQNVQNASGVFVWGIGSTPAEKMRLTSGGNLLVGTTVDSGEIGNFSGSVAFGGTVRAGVTKNTSSGAYIYQNNNNGSFEIAALIGGNAAANGTGSVHRINFGANDLSLTAGGTGSSLNFGVNSTERARITSSGNLLVGTTTDNANARVHFAGATQTTNGVNITYGGVGSALIRIVDGNALTLGLDTANGSTERARITSGGYFKASNTGSYSGVAVPYHEFVNNQNTVTLYSDNTNTGASAVCFYSRLPTGATGYHLQAQTAAAVVYQVLANGNVQNTNNSYGAISDLKLKENISDATPKLSGLNRLRVVNYNLKGDTLKQIGLIAQEVEQVFPGLVEETPDVDPDTKEPTGTVTKAVKYSVLVPMLLKAVQELNAEVNALKAQVQGA